MFIIFGSLGLFVVILIAFVILQKTGSNKKSVTLKKITKEISTRNAGASVFYQKVYVKIESLPIFNRYLRKIRRRLELFSRDDEYALRRDSGKITLIATILTFVLLIVIAFLNRDNTFKMLVSFLGVIFLVESITEQLINKVENRLLNQQLEFFSEVRHAYHTTNMIEEAIYDASLMEEQEIVSQANAIYDVMISADPEMELERYYDVAPNKFLKIFAGVSYLTKEFGDRKVNGISLYLKDMNNITQELQLEIMKRDKIEYLFRSLTVIAILPIFAMNYLKRWALDSFTSTASFYEGSGGFLAEILLIILIFASYALLVRIKDNSDKIKVYSSNEAWQERVYRLPFIEKIVDALVPNNDNPAYLSITKLLKDTASTLKIEWLYVNRVVCAFIAFFVSIFIVSQMHDIAIEKILYGDTVDNNIMGKLSEKEMREARATSASDRFFISAVMNGDKVKEINGTKILSTTAIQKIIREKTEKEATKAIANQLLIVNEMELSNEKANAMAQKIFRFLGNERNRKVHNGQTKLQEAILKSGIEMPRDNFVVDLANKIISLSKKDGETEITVKYIALALKDIYSNKLSPEQIISIAKNLYSKMKDLSSEYFKWTELLIAIFIAVIAYQIPKILLIFQRKMRQMEMDDEVMQFQTIILMLMHIERVSVEYIVEWLTRFSNIFREPLQRCLNNYESGAYEALEDLKDEVTFKPFIRIVESLQSAVENVKITDAFDELESERAFFQEKRKEANERLIARKTMIGKVIGFAPMVILFVGYLIVPLILTSLGDMGVYFNQMSSMM